MVRTRKKSDSRGTTSTDPSAEIDIPTDNVTTMSATNDAGNAITETGMNETIPRSTIGEGTTGIMGIRTSDAIKREDISAEKSVGRQPKITTKGQV